MNPQPRINPDDTRARIIETAQTLFRRLGFAKLTVADIANELGMSPANIYRFFPSKSAIVESICQCCLGELEKKVWAIARGKGPAAQRLEQLVLAVFAYHRENLLQEQRVADIVQFALEASWDVVHAHQNVVRNGFELILRDGIDTGEFEPVDPAETARLIFRSLIGYMHPALISQALSAGEDLETEARAAVRFVLRAVTPRT